jgi:hypothetical protein
MIAPQKDSVNCFLEVLTKYAKGAKSSGQATACLSLTVKYRQPFD